MSELAEKLKTLAEKAAAGTLTDEDRIELAELGKVEGEKILPAKLQDMAKQAEKEAGLSLAAKSELQQIGATLSEELLPRYAFDRLSPAAKSEVLKSGVRLVDAAPPVEKREPGPNEKSRAIFDAMTPAERTAFIKGGGRLVDMPA